MWCCVGSVKRARTAFHPAQPPLDALRITCLHHRHRLQRSRQRRRRKSAQERHHHRKKMLTIPNRRLGYHLLDGCPMTFTLFLCAARQSPPPPSPPPPLSHAFAALRTALPRLYSRPSMIPTMLPPHPPNLLRQEAMQLPTLLTGSRCPRGLMSPPFCVAASPHSSRIIPPFLCAASHLAFPLLPANSKLSKPCSRGLPQHHVPREDLSMRTKSAKSSSCNPCNRLSRRLLPHPMPPL